MARKREHFRVLRVIRRFDWHSGKFIIDVSFETAPPLPSGRVVATAEAFGLGLDKWERFTVFENVELKIGQKDVVYITGDSGSGKSVLLRALEKDIKRDLKLTSININDIKPEQDKPLIETVGATVEEGLELLSRVGLGDAFLFLRTFSQLSDGQKYRFKIAKMIESKAQFWIMDEFAATLDRDTARVVAWNLQKVARSEGKCVLAATTHGDLLRDLNPDVHVHKRFGKEITVDYSPNPPSQECSLVEEMRVEQGTTADWKQLSGFHYRSHRIAAPRKIFCLKRGDELCGVIVYCYPPVAAFGRRLVLPRMTMRELNRKLSIIMRVVVSPKYRTVGLGTKLVRDTLPLAGTEYVEMSAVMAKINPFAEKAGMRRVAEQAPPKQILKIVELLRVLGFSVELLGSEKYVLGVLKGLSGQDVERIRQAFRGCTHPRLVQSLCSRKVHGWEQQYREQVERAGLARLALLVKMLGFLMQTKVYLFWQKS